MEKIHLKAQKRKLYTWEWMQVQGLHSNYIWCIPGQYRDTQGLFLWKHLGDSRTKIKQLIDNHQSKNPASSVFYNHTLNVYYQIQLCLLSSNQTKFLLIKRPSATWKQNIGHYPFIMLKVTRKTYQSKMIDKPGKICFTYERKSFNNDINQISTYFIGK